MGRKQTIPLAERELIRTTEAQEFYGIGKSKFWHWISCGYFPVFRPEGEKSRTTFVNRSDVEAFIKTGKITPQPIQ